LDVIALDPRRTQLALRDGSAMFDVGYLPPGQVFEVATPYGAVDLNQPGLYNVGFDNGNVLVSVLSGLAQVVGLGGSGQISKGEVLTLLGTTAAEIALSRIDNRYAGSLLDDYYGYQYPQYYDGRYADYNAYLSDPYYFDPYRRNVSYQYASPYIPGLNDLDYYGNWQNLSGYGYGWSPRVDTGWAPYQQGYWINDYPYGPTWVSNEPWGYAPYHYGRWAYVGNQWYWIPDSVTSTPTYSPALVAFIPAAQQNAIGWVPLGPGDPYVPRYYDTSWNPYYLSQTSVVNPTLSNLYVPNAVAVLPVEDFDNGYGGQRIRHWDRGEFDGNRAVLDPLLLTPLRNAVVHSAWGRGKIAIPPGIAKKLNETQVVVSNVPPAPPFRKDLARSLRVTSVPEKVKEQKLRTNEGRPGKSVARVVPEQQPVQRVDDRQARQQFKEMQRQQRVEQPNQRQIQRAEGVRVGNPKRAAAPVFERPQQRVERPQIQRSAPVRTYQPEVRRVERQGGGRPDKQMSRPAPVQPVRSAPAVERRGPPVQVQQRHQQQPQPQRQQVQTQPQQRQQVEHKGGPPANAPRGGGPGGGGGKGHGKKP